MAAASLYQRSSHKRPSSLLTRTNLLLIFSLLIILGFFLPYLGISQSLFSNTHFAFQSKWRNYSLEEAVSFVARNGTVIVCIVSEPYLDFLNNWLISVTRHKHQDKVLVIAEDYNTLYRVNQRWPGHAVLIPPVLESNSAHKFGSLVWFFHLFAIKLNQIIYCFLLGFFLFEIFDLLAVNLILICLQKLVNNLWCYMLIYWILRVVHVYWI